MTSDDRAAGCECFDPVLDVDGCGDAVLSVPEGDVSLTIALDERRAGIAKADGLGRRVLSGIACASIAAHVAGLVVLVALFREPIPVAQHDETVVEVVQTIPSPDRADPPPPRIETADAPEPPSEAQHAMRALRDEIAALQAQKDSLQEEARQDRERLAEAEAQADRRSAAGAGDAFEGMPESFRAVAMSAKASDGAIPMGYDQEVFSQLAKAKKDGHYRMTPGVALVAFDIDAAGTLVTVRLDRSSGDGLLDQEALAIVRRAAPFPAPPKDAHRHFSAAMSFVAER